MRDLGTPSGTWLNEKRLDSGCKRMLRPGDMLEFGQPGSGLRYKIKVGAAPQTSAGSNIVLTGTRKVEVVDGEAAHNVKSGLLLMFAIMPKQACAIAHPVQQMQCICVTCLHA